MLFVFASHQDYYGCCSHSYVILRHNVDHDRKIRFFRGIGNLPFRAVARRCPNSLDSGRCRRNDATSGEYHPGELGEQYVHPVLYGEAEFYIACPFDR